MQVDELIEEAVNDGVAKNIEIAIFDNSNIEVFHNSEKLYDIASLTKVVSSLLVSVLQNKGLIDVEENVSKYLPYYTHDTKVYELLVHKSGLKDFRFVEMDEIKEKLIMDEKVTRYADINYILLYLILEEIGGFINLLKLHVLKPLSIDESAFDFSAKDKVISNAVPTEYKADRGQICGTVHDSKCYAMGGVSCHAGVFTNIHTFTKIFANLDKIIDIDWYQSFLEEYTMNNRTIGFSIGDERNQSGLFDKDCYFHTGFAGTSILITKDLKKGIVVFTNRIYPTRENMKIFEFRTLISNEFYREIL